LSEHARKRARAVLRGRDGGNTILLLDNLRFATLNRASLWETKLIGADLYGAKLYGATFILADLSGAVRREVT